MKQLTMTHKRTGQKICDILNVHGPTEGDCYH